MHKICSVTSVSLELTVSVGPSSNLGMFGSHETHHPKEVARKSSKNVSLVQSKTAKGTVDASDKLMQPTFSSNPPTNCFYRQNFKNMCKFLQCRPHWKSLFFAGFFRNPGSVNPRFASVKLPSHGGIESSQKSNLVGSSTSLQVAPVAGFFQNQLFPPTPLVTMTEGAIPQSSPPCRVDPDAPGFWFQKT